MLEKKFLNLFSIEMIAQVILIRFLCLMEHPMVYTSCLKNLFVPLSVELCILFPNIQFTVVW